MNKSLLHVNDIMFCAFTREEARKNVNRIETLGFDRRNDFLIDGEFAGIAVRIELFNNSPSDSTKGSRRKVALAIVDTTERGEIVQKQLTVSFGKDSSNRTVYQAFMHEDIGFKSGHTYKLVVKDLALSTNISWKSLHIFGQKELGHPTKWYNIDFGGIVPECINDIYRSVLPDYGHYVNVRFHFAQNFGENLPEILPELEMRIHYPGDKDPLVFFNEPRCVDFDSNLYIVNEEFIPKDGELGAYYAEILCMQYPIAGFVFRTDGPEVSGDWYDEGILPMLEYSSENADKRFNRLIYKNSRFKAEDKNEDESVADKSDGLKTDEDFEKALDAFIQTEEFKFGDEEKPEVVKASYDVKESDKAGEQARESSLLIGLDRLTGLKKVKEKLSVYEKIVIFNRLRLEKGLPANSLPLHSMFLGSPGTGKTTVAKMIGVMLRRAGILSKGHVVVRERATLLGQNYNSESEKTLEAIEKAKGGILLIDEAYQLYQPGDPRDPGKFVIETLLTALSDESNRDWMLVLAGYPEEMKRMFEMNPGFKSRIPDSNIYLFDDFTEDELMEIAENYLSRYQFTLSPEAHAALSLRIRSDYSQRERNFGNARHVINMIQTEIIPAMAVRVVAMETATRNSLSEILAEDIPTPAFHKTTWRKQIGFAG